MAMITRFASSAVALFTVLTLAAMPVRADLYTWAASGTITSKSIADSTIPVGTPWSFEITYNTAAPDLDSEFSDSPDPSFGVFANTSTPPAMTYFHYRAGTYEVALRNPADFGTFSNIHITFTSVNALDINLDAPTFFPTMSGSTVDFHADFNRFGSPPIFSSDALPTNTAIGPSSFQGSTITLRIASGGDVSGSNVTGLTLTAGLAGDFNSDGVVSAADYAYWRKNFAGDPAKYYAWRADFGASLAPGSGAAIRSGNLLSASVPEPTAVALILSGTFFAAGRRFRRVRCGWGL
jgi:hypothetical protein